MAGGLLQCVIPDETALQLFARNFSEPIPTDVFFLGAVRPGQILEIAGPSGSGKTTLLLQIAANAILPSKIAGHGLGGLQEHVLLIDLNNKIDILRLVQMLNTRIQGALETLGWDSEGSELDLIVNESLARFHLVSCKDSRETLATVKTIQPFISSLQEAGGMHLLLVDNVAAFHWIDAAVKGDPRSQGQAPAALTLHRVHAAAAAELKLLAKQLRLAVVATKHAFRSEHGTGGEDIEHWRHKEVLPKAWADAVSQRILLARKRGGVGALPSSFVARWEKPPQRQQHSFQITDAGVVPDGKL